MTRHQRWTLAVVGAAVFMLSLDITIVNVALPSIQRDLDASFVELQWVVDAYTIALACVVLAAGSVADLVGRKRMFTLGMALFTLGSLVCGLASEAVILALFRGLQGLGASLLFATSLPLLSHAFPSTHRRFALGVWSVIAGAAVSLGPVAGGALAAGLSWRWIFLINVPLGVVGLVVAWFQLTESTDPGGGRIDRWGVATLTAGLVALIVALLEAPQRGFSDPVVVGCAAAAVAFVAAFVAIQRRVARPLVDLTLFRSPSFSGLQVSGFLMAVGFTSVFGYLALYLQGVEGYSPLQSGLSLLPVNVLSGACAPIGVRLARRLSPHVIVAGGTTLVGIGLLAIVPAPAGSGWQGLFIGLSLMGIGVGLAAPTAGDLAVRVAPPARAGMAAGTNDAFRQVGSATGIAGLGALLHAVIVGRLGDGPASDLVAAGALDRASAAGIDHAAAVSAFTAGFDLMFAVAGTLTLLSAAAAWRYLRNIPEPEAPMPEPAVVPTMAAAAGSAELAATAADVPVATARAARR